MKSNYQAVFFDLDGTLLDTAPDLYAAVLATLRDLGRRLIEFDVFRAYVGNGTVSILQKTLGLEPHDPVFSKARDLLLTHYENMLREKTDYFPGMCAVLDQLDNQRMLWGVVTNKPSYFTSLLLDAFCLSERCCSVVSGDTLTQKKPSPEPLLHAACLAGVNASSCVYVGDTRQDIVAARAAGMISIAVLYGYYHPEDPPAAWGADYLIKQPSQLLNVLM